MLRESEHRFWYGARPYMHINSHKHQCAREKGVQSQNVAILLCFIILVIIFMSSKNYTAERRGTCWRSRNKINGNRKYLRVISLHALFYLHSAAFYLCVCARALCFFQSCTTPPEHFLSSCVSFFASRKAFKSAPALYIHSKILISLLSFLMVQLVS